MQAAHITIHDDKANMIIGTFDSSYHNSTLTANQNEPNVTIANTMTPCNERSNGVTEGTLQVEEVVEEKFGPGANVKRANVRSGGVVLFALGLFSFLSL